jgi:Flp pilus assembly protein TadG
MFGAHSTHRRRVRRGVGLVYGILIILALSSLASLAVDYARVQLVKNQLGAAADAAALAATHYAGSDIAAAQQAAVALAKANNADGQPVIVDPATDVQFVDWDESTRTYEVLTGPNRARANAVRVTACRTAARGNAVSLPFAKVIGLSACDVNSAAIAAIKESKYAAVGLDFVTMTGRASQGSVMSNGDISLSGNARIDGDAYPGPNHTVTGAANVTGKTTSLTKVLSYPPVNPGTAATINDNAKVSAISKGSLNISGQKNIIMPAGTYYLKNISLSGGSTLTIMGPVTVYVTGSVTLTGHASTADNLPQNFKIMMLGTGKVSLSGNTDLYANVYAPTSPIVISGEGDIYGAVIGKNITMSGNAGIHSEATVKGTAKLVK